MILISTALFAEAKPFIDEFKLKHSSRIAKWDLYANSDIRLIISGVGVIRSAAATALLIEQISEDKRAGLSVVNVGIAGSPIASIGECFLINQIRYPTLGRTYLPDILFPHKLPEAGVLCVDRPLQNKESIPKSLTVVDMETAGFFDSAIQFVSPHQILSFKIVSDQLDGIALERGFVNSLIAQRLDQIVQTIESSRKQTNEKRDLFTDYEGIHKKISDELSLTVTQQRQLKNWIRNRALRGGEISVDDFLELAEEGTKEERNRVVQLIKQKLLKRDV